MPTFEDTVASLDKHAIMQARRELTNSVIAEISTHEELFQAVGNSAETDVAISMHPLCDLRILEILSNHENWFVRAKVAYRDLTTADLLVSMASVEKHPSVVLEIITHPNLSLEAALVLLSNVSKWSTKVTFDLVWDRTYTRFYDELVAMVGCGDNSVRLPESWFRKTIVG